MKELYIGVRNGAVTASHTNDADDDLNLYQILAIAINSGLSKVELIHIFDEVNNEEVLDQWCNFICDNEDDNEVPF